MTESRTHIPGKEHRPMMAHVFDLKTVLLAKHAQHIVMIHFPIALFFVSGVFDVMAHRNKNDSLRSAGYYNLVAASISSVMAVATGVIAWQIMYGGKFVVISADAGIIIH